MCYMLKKLVQSSYFFIFLYAMHNEIYHYVISENEVVEFFF